MPQEWRCVRDHIPLEQGLRHLPETFTPFDCYVRDHIPLEQGLRRTRKHLFVAGEVESETIFH